jgi:hypothetical protein
MYEKGSIVGKLIGISFDRSWMVQSGDIILVNGVIRKIEHKAESVVYVEEFPNSEKVYVNFLNK